MAISADSRLGRTREAALCLARAGGSAASAPAMSHLRSAIHAFGALLTAGTSQLPSASNRSATLIPVTNCADDGSAGTLRNGDRGRSRRRHDRHEWSARAR